MKACRAEIRETCVYAPDYAALHPGYTIIATEFTETRE
jgi:hypothetical protein